jgi:MarR family transcriptional regulator, 2-MHQ and catechol-resistance regulon repressor
VSECAVFRVPPGFEEEWAGARADATEVVLNVIRAGEALNSLVDSFVRERGLPSSTALIVLEVLRGEGGPLAPSVVASRCFVSRPALSGVMDTLERRELLRRYPDPQDRRRALVEITANGVDTLEGLLPDLHRAEVSWTDGLADTQKATMLRNLGRLQKHLRADSTQPHR